MIVTPWNNGSHNKTGAGYGIKLQPIDRDSYFNRDWKFIELELDGFTNVIKVNVAKRSFWGNSCRELIHKEIGRWLIHNGLAPWSKGKPPKLQLEHTQDNHFRLTKQ